MSHHHTRHLSLIGLVLGLGACTPKAGTSPTGPAVTLASTSSAAPGPVPDTDAPKAAERVLVRDFAPSLGESAVPDVTAQPILKELYPRFLRSADACANGPSDLDGDLARARAAGDFVPLITSRLTGSFTAPGHKQTAVLVGRFECNASHADGYGTHELVVFEGDAPVMREDVDFSHLDLARDLDRDGRDELIASSGDSHMGYTVEFASLVSLADGQVTVREQLGQVYEDDCGTDQEATGIRGTKLWLVAGRLEREEIAKPCPPPQP